MLFFFLFTQAGRHASIAWEPHSNSATGEGPGFYLKATAEGVLLNDVALDLGKPVRLESRDVIGFGAVQNTPKSEKDDGNDDEVAKSASSSSSSSSSSSGSGPPRPRTTVQFLLPSRVLGVVTEDAIDHAAKLSVPPMIGGVGAGSGSTYI